MRNSKKRNRAKAFRSYASDNNKSEKENLTDAELKELLKSIPK